MVAPSAKVKAMDLLYELSGGADQPSWPQPLLVHSPRLQLQAKVETAIEYVAEMSPAPPLRPLPPEAQGSAGTVGIRPVQPTGLSCPDTGLGLFPLSNTVDVAYQTTSKY